MALYRGSAPRASPCAIIAAVTRAIAACGAALVSLDSVMNIAFPAISAAFAVAPERMRWVVISYVLTYALTALAGGALADRVGHARVFQAGVALSGVAFALGGLAPSFVALLGARVVQGFAGGLVYGTAPGLVTLAGSAATRGRALGTLNAAIGFAFAAGPLAAGVLVDHAGWRSVFHVRVPLAALTLALALRLPRAGPVTWARPAAPRDLLRGAAVRPGVLAFLANAAIFCVWLLAPFYLIGVRGLAATTGGMLFMLTPLGTAVAAPLAGRLADRMGPWPPVVAGLLVETLGLGLLGRAGAGTSLPAVAALLFAAGLGLGIFQVPNMAAAMAAFGPGQQGVAGGFIFFARTLGTVFGVAALAQIFAARRLAVGDAAFGECFVAAALGAGVAAALAAVWGRRRS